MPDREKVIKGLECCLSGPMKCDNCPYKEDDGTTVPACVKKLRNQAKELLKGQEKIVRCKDCRHFAVKDYWGRFHGVPVLGASDQPTCTKWGGGDCKTSPDGYCFLAERR